MDQAEQMYQAVQKRRQLRSAKSQLRQQQELFIHHYLICGNAAKAAKKAGYADPEYGRQLLTKKNVKAILAYERERLARKFEATRERAIEELCRLVYVDPAEFYDEDGNLKPIHEIPPHARAAIAEITPTKVKLWDKAKNLEMLLKYLGLFHVEPQIQVQVHMTGPQVLAELAAFIERTGIAKGPEQEVIDVEPKKEITFDKADEADH